MDTRFSLFHLARLSLIAATVLAALFLGSAKAEWVVVVSADNPNTTLSEAELSDIFLGRRSRFPNGSPVVPVNQNENSVAYRLFHAQYLNMTPAQVRSHWSRLIFTGRGQPPGTVPDSSAMADRIAGNARGIGYLGIEFVDERLQVVQIE